MTDSVLVLGAGELGLSVIEALAAHPLKKATKLAVLLRQATLDSAAPEKKKLVQRLKALNADFEAADVAQAPVEELAGILARYDTVVCCTGMAMPAGTQRKITAAALRAGMRRFFPWQFGMDYDAIGAGSSQDLFDEQLEVRRALRAQSATRWTLVSTGLFMSFLLVAAFGVVDLGARTVRALGRWDNRITLTTPRDIGRVTADVVLDPRGVADQAVFMAGDTVTYAQVADLVEERFGGTFKRELWDHEALKAQIAEDPNTMVKYRDTFAQGRGVAWDVEETINAERGIPMTDVRAYLKDMDAEPGEE